MSALPPSARGAFERLAPTVEGFGAGNPVAVPGPAQMIDLNALWGGPGPGVEGQTINRLKRGGAWVSIQARGGILSVRVADPAGVAGTTGGAAGNGLNIADGDTEEFWVPGTALHGFDVFGSAAMTAFIWFSSRNIENV